MMADRDLAAHPLCQIARALAWTALALLAYGVLGWLAAQPWFALTTLEVKTPVVHVTEAQVRLVAERQVRGTFFTVDLDHVQESLQKLPWVREARVERRWPDTLVVSLVEHQPLARWNDDALVSEAGDVFVAALSQKLPRLTGPEDAVDEVVAAYRRHQAALAPLGLTLDELRLSPRRAWRMRLNNGMQIALGRLETEARMARFIAVYPRLFETQEGAASGDATLLPATVDLRYPDGFALRMPDGRVPAAFAAPAKPSTT